MRGRASLKLNFMKNITYNTWPLSLTNILILIKYSAEGKLLKYKFIYISLKTSLLLELI